ncbi:MAG: hypothetical protein RJA58_884 [Pseudomonadota bacterium]|jgi:uncharacterized membrane protein YedE/YeeE
MNRLLLSLPAIAGVLAVTWYAGLRAGFLLILGLGFGAALSGAKFGFTTGWRNLIVQKDPWGMVAQMVLLGLCSLLAFPLLHANPDEIVGAVSPITWALLLGAVLFGFAMQLADGCGSGTLYKAGSASPISWAVLPAFVAGSFVGASHQPGWESLGGPLSQPGTSNTVPAIDLLAKFGLTQALLFTVAGCLLIAVLSILYSRRYHSQKGQPLPKVPPRWLWGALFLALLYAVHLVIAGQPWGIVYGLGLWGAKVVSAVGVDLSQDAFWGAAPHATRITEPLLWDMTSVTNIGLLYGALMASRWNLKATSASISPALAQFAVSILAGLLMGYASRMAYGCNVGAYLGGIASASAHGWIWLVFAFFGSLIGVRARQKVGLA